MSSAPTRVLNGKGLGFTWALDFAAGVIWCGRLRPAARRGDFYGLLRPC